MRNRCRYPVAALRVEYDAAHTRNMPPGMFGFFFLAPGHADPLFVIGRTIPDMIHLVAEDQVRLGMSSLLKPGGLFKKDAIPIVSSTARDSLREDLGTLLNSANTGKLPQSMERISATAGRDTVDRIRALGENFSEHVRNALNVYLKALEGQGR